MKIPTDIKDIKALRDYLSTACTQLCSTAENLPEPWKGHFTALKDQYNAFLSKLPPTDQAPAALDASCHLSMFASCLSNASALATLLGAQMNSIGGDVKNQVALALNSAVDSEIAKRIKDGVLIAKEAVDGLVTAAVDTRIKAGELLTKDTHSQLCSAAKDAGITEGKLTVQREIDAKASKAALIVTRKGLLQTAGLPMPTATLEALLAGSEDEFKSLQETAEKRKAALAKKGVAYNSASPVFGRLYLPEDEWTTFVSLLEDAVASGGSLAGAGAPPATGAPNFRIIA